MSIKLIKFIYHPFSATTEVVFSYPSDLTELEARLKSAEALAAAKSECETMQQEPAALIKHWPEGSAYGKAVFEKMKARLENQGFEHIQLGYLPTVSMFV